MPDNDPHSTTNNLCRQLGFAIVALAVATSTAMTSLADDAKLEAYGRHLARECTSCHRIDGIDNGIPSIVGWPSDTFVSTMQFYRDGVRTNQVMVSVANSLTDPQIQALATFFAAIPRPAKKGATPPVDKRP